MIVEEASGQSYKDYIKEHILLPLGMTHTSVGPFWMDVGGLLDHKAKGYSYTGKGFRREDEMHLRMYPAGAMNGTAADLLLFAEWLAKAPGEEIRLFKSPETKERLFKENGVPMGQTPDSLMASGSMRIIPEYSGMRVEPMASRRSFGWNRKLNVQS